jgi:hypothetical protein
MNRRTYNLLIQVLSLAIGAELGIGIGYTVVERINTGVWVWERPPFRTLPLPETMPDNPRFRPVPAPSTPTGRPAIRQNAEPRYTLK